MQVNGTTSAQYWQCLGVWAMAGQPVTVTVPSGVSAASGARLRIGGWTDWTYHKTKWYRLPEMSRWYSVNGTATTIGSATGGLVYLELPSGLSLGTVSVQVSGERGGGGGGGGGAAGTNSCECHIVLL